MVLAYFVYTLLPASMAFLFYIASQLNKKSASIVYSVAIALFSLIIGLRYGVGIDYFSYLEYYQYPSAASYKDSMEVGYEVLNRTCRELGFHFCVIYILTSCIQIAPIIGGFRINKAEMPIFILLYFLTSYVFFSLNGIRQAIAFSFIFYSLSFIQKRSFVKYALWITFATLFHKSAAFFYPLYFVLNKEYFKNRFLQINLLLFTFLLGNIIQQYIWLLVPFFSSYVLGMELSDTQYALLADVDWNSGGAGLAKYFWLIINILIVLYYVKIRCLYKDKLFDIYYNLYFIGALLENIIGNSYLLRFNIYFVNYRIPIFVFFIFALLKTLNGKNYAYNIILLVGVISGLLLFYYIAIYKKAAACAPYQFVSF